MSVSNILKYRVKKDGIVRRALYRQNGQEPSLDAPPKAILDTPKMPNVIIAVATQFNTIASVPTYTPEQQCQILKQGIEFIELLCCFCMETQEKGDLLALHADVQQEHADSHPNPLQRKEFRAIYSETAPFHLRKEDKNQDSVVNKAKIHNANINNAATDRKLGNENNNTMNNNFQQKKIPPLCGEFNRGYCNRQQCRYIHACQKCYKQHPRINCPSNTNINSRK